MKSRKVLCEACSRAGVLGNPSDGFFGKTLSMPVRNFRAKVSLEEADEMRIVSQDGGYPDLASMVDSMNVFGLYGVERLIKAAIKEFGFLAEKMKISLKEKRFTISCETTVPRQVGLAGSSALITATLKCLCTYFEVEISKEELANVVLAAETKHLGIAAGLQDRVVQVFDEPIFMDFDKTHMKEKGFGKYEPVKVDLLPNFYLCFKKDVTHDSNVHNNMQERFEKGEELVLKTMKELAENASRGYKCLKSGDLKGFDECIDHNFDLRKKIYKIDQRNLKMIELARTIGATAKFGGGGGCIIGTFKNEKMLSTLKEKFQKMDCIVEKVKLE